MPSGYSKYETFDEYSLKGLNKNSFLQKPYVAVKDMGDSISVIVFPEHDDTQHFTYYNKGSHWYSLDITQISPSLYETCNCDTTPSYKEKYIYNDSIIEYSYYKDGLGVRTFESVHLITKSQKVIFSADSFCINQDDKFNDLRRMCSNYIYDFPLESEKSYQEQYSYIFNRVIKGDTLFEYLYKEEEKDKVIKLGDLYKVSIMSRLGLFYLDEAENITYEIEQRSK